MKFVCPLIVVKDIEKSKKFYKNIFNLDVVDDFGENVVLSGGVALQTIKSWKEFIHLNDGDIKFCSNNGELYFEEDDFDVFLNSLQNKDINYVHEIIEHRWGQRVVRIYDPDFHIVEVGENMKSVVNRFINQGMSEKEVAKRMDVSVEYVLKCLK